MRKPVKQLELCLYNARVILYNHKILYDLFISLPIEYQKFIVNEWYKRDREWLIDYMKALMQLNYES